MKICLCFLVIGGVILVVQPTFIFGSEIKEIAKNTTTYKDNSVSLVQHGHKKTIGAIIGLVCALSVGFVNVSAAKTHGNVSRDSLMIAGGIGTYLLTMIGYLLTPGVSNETMAKVTLFERAGLTMAVVTASIIAGHLLVIANQVNHLKPEDII